MEKTLKDNIWKINSTCLNVRCELKNDIKEAVIDFERWVKANLNYDCSKEEKLYFFEKYKLELTNHWLEDGKQKIFGEW